MENNLKPIKWQKATVFISSTFNDMHAERDYLIKEVFPELTEWCEKRKIRLKDIDLRWGVSEEDASNSKTIETCLNHIDDSRPFFLCFLGQRRGWVPNFKNDISDETKEHYKTFRDNEIKDIDAQLEGRSATEMEIEHALLEPLYLIIDSIDSEGSKQEKKDPTKHSLFFFRDDSYVNEINDHHKEIIYTNDHILEIYLSDIFYNLYENSPEVYYAIIKEIASNPLSYKDLLWEMKCSCGRIYPRIMAQIAEYDEDTYYSLVEEFESPTDCTTSPEEFLEIFKAFGEDAIKSAIDDIRSSKEEEFNIARTELEETKQKIINKKELEEKKFIDNQVSANDKINVEITRYSATWNPDLILPELNTFTNSCGRLVYTHNENLGRLTDFKSEERFVYSDGKVIGQKADGEALKDVIISQFKSQFEIAFPENIEYYESRKESEFNEDLLQQDNFCFLNSEGFVPREEYSSKLEEYIDDSEDNRICLVSANAGFGKTMLLAKFASDIEDEFNERFQAKYGNKKLYKRFCGASNLSSNAYPLWRSIIYESGIVDFDEDNNPIIDDGNGNDIYPNNIDELKRNIAGILNRIASKGDSIIIIDAVNQMPDGLDMLKWLTALPENLKMIVSVKEDPSDENFTRQINIIKNRSAFSRKSFVLKQLDYMKDDLIDKYLGNLNDYINDSNDNRTCFVYSDVIFDKTYIFDRFKEMNGDKSIYTISFGLIDMDYAQVESDETHLKVIGDIYDVEDALSEFLSGKGEDSIIFFDSLNINKIKMIYDEEDLDEDELEGYEALEDGTYAFEYSPLDILRDIQGAGYNIVFGMSSSDKLEGINSNDIDDIKDELDLSAHSFTIEELNPEKTKLINSYLQNYLKQLDGKEIHEICNFRGSHIPLYLKILLAELRVFGSFDQLKDKIRMFGDEPLTAFDHVLSRLEDDEARLNANDPSKNLVKLIFSLLAFARVGLSLDELVAIIHAETGLDEKYISDTVNINLRQVRPFMARKESRHDFFYESFKEAARKRYSDMHSRCNKALADYFFKEALNDGSYDLSKDYYVFKGEDARAYKELPYHLYESDDLDKLEKTLSSYSFIENKLGKLDIYDLILDYQLTDFKDDENSIDSDSFDGSQSASDSSQSASDSSLSAESSDDEHPVVLIGRALELSAPNLIRDPDQLASQLWARLVDIPKSSNNYASIESLLGQIQESTDDKWLKSSSAVLYSPKSSIIKRIKPDGKKSTNAIVLTKDSQLIIGNEDGVLNIYDLENNYMEVLEEGNSRVIKILLINDDKEMIVATENGIIKFVDIDNRTEIKSYDLKSEGIDAKITDIYLSKTYNKIYISSFSGVFSIDLETDEIRTEDIDPKDYAHILVPRRNESIFVANDKEVDGWDVYNLRKSYNQHHQHQLSADEIDEDIETIKDTSGDIRFMGLVKRFLILISENGQMKIWNTLKNSESGGSIDETLTSSLNDKFAQAITLEDENQVITISDMGLLRLYNIPEPKNPEFNLLKEIQTGISSPSSIEYYKNGDDRFVIVGNVTNDVNVIDLNKKIEEDTGIKHIESVLTIKVHDNQMITASENGQVFVWDYENESHVDEFANKFRNNCISYNYDNKQLICAGTKTEKDGTIKNKLAIWKIGDEEARDIRDTKRIIDLAQNSSSIIYIEEGFANSYHLNIDGSEHPIEGVPTTLCAIFNSNEIYVGFEDGSISKYSNGFESFKEASNSKVLKIKNTDDSLIVAYEDGSIRVFGFDGSVMSLDEHANEVINLDIQDNVLVSVSKDNTIKLWNLDNGECIYTYYLDIYATAVNIGKDKIAIGDILGNVHFFSFENF